MEVEGTVHNGNPRTENLLGLRRAPDIAPPPECTGGGTEDLRVYHVPSQVSRSSRPPPSCELTTGETVMVVGVKSPGTLDPRTTIRVLVYRVSTDSTLV